MHLKRPNLSLASGTRWEKQVCDGARGPAIRGLLKVTGTPGRRRRTRLRLFFYKESEGGILTVGQGSHEIQLRSYSHSDTVHL